MPPSMKLRRASIVDAAALAADFACHRFLGYLRPRVDDPKGIAKYVAKHFTRAKRPRDRIGDHDDDHALGRG